MNFNIKDNLVGEPDPPSTGSTMPDLVAHLLFSTLGDDAKADQYHSDFSVLIRNLSTATLKYLKFLPSDSLDNLFYRPDIDPLLHDDDVDDPLDAHHPLDDLYLNDHPF